MSSKLGTAQPQLVYSYCQAWEEGRSDRQKIRNETLFTTFKSLLRDLTPYPPPTVGQHIAPINPTNGRPATPLAYFLKLWRSPPPS